MASYTVPGDIDKQVHHVTQSAFVKKHRKSSAWTTIDGEATDMGGGKHTSTVTARLNHEHPIQQRETEFSAGNIPAAVLFTQTPPIRSRISKDDECDQNHVMKNTQRERI